MTADQVAIVGMACRFPGARTPDEFWANMAAGVESVTDLTTEELAAAGVPDHLLTSPSYVRRAAVIDDYDMFDAAFFGMTPREAELMDPQQRLFLEHCWTALESAGYHPRSMQIPVGVFGGAGLNTYVEQVRSNADVLRHVAGEGALHAAGSVENDLDYLTTRVSYKLDLTGPSINVATACSTSLVAVHLACQSLLTYEIDAALAGGVAVSPPEKVGYEYHDGGISSADGYTRSFDASATGTLLGSGVGVLVLKRLEDAVRDGDTVYGTIVGSAINNDGSAKAGFTAPGVRGQVQVILAAHEAAGVDPRSITMMEAHGTATAVGDPIEVTALTRAFRRGTDERQFCSLGTAKANIGHMDAAAGVAGIIRAVQAMRHRTIPPQINLTSINPALDLSETPFYIATVARPWETRDAEPRRAAVSSFGFGGTNAHVVLQEPPAQEARQDDPNEQGSWCLLPLSAATPEAFTDYAVELSSWSASAQMRISDVARTLHDSRAQLPVRGFVVARNLPEASRRWRAASGAAGGSESECLFVFPGQGSQYPGMAAGLYAAYPTFRRTFDYCADAFAAVADIDLHHLVLRPGQGADELSVTCQTQPALLAVELAATDLLAEHGLVPAAMLGHSLGELVAATVAGVLDRDDAVRVVAERARLMNSAPAGAMLSVALPATELEPLLPGAACIGARNSESLHVVSGTHDEIAELERRLADRDVANSRLRMSIGAHSPLMEEASQKFGRFLADVRLAPPSVPFISNVTGTWITDEEACSAAYWARQLRQPVRFADGAAELLRRPGVVVEVGPGASMSSLLRQAPDDVPDRSYAPLLRRPNHDIDDVDHYLTGLGLTWSRGLNLRWEGLLPDGGRHVPLPTNPFQRQRFWIEASDAETLRLTRGLMSREPDPTDWLWQTTWTGTPSARHLVRSGAERSVLLVTDDPDGPLAEAFAAHGGSRVHIVDATAGVNTLRIALTGSDAPQTVVHAVRPIEQSGGVALGLQQACGQGWWASNSTKALSCTGLRLQRSPARKAFAVKRIARDQSRRNADRRRRRVEARHRQAGHWSPRPVPVLTAGPVHYEVGANVDATSFGGIAALHRLITKIGLPEAIDADLELLKVHLPYHESDHVLNLAYNVACGGTRLEDLERLRHDTAYMNALGADLIPDPTTAGDFCRRFGQDDVATLMDAINSVRPKLWSTRARELLDPVAYVDVDGTLAPTTGSKKAGMDISYKGIWGYHPLIVSLANTREVLYLVNRPGNVPSHTGAAEWINKSIDLVAPHTPRVCLRGDTDFSLTAHFDDWADRVDFVFGMDNSTPLRAHADALPETAWQRLERPAPYQNKTGQTRARRDDIKAAIVTEREYLNLRLNYEDVAEFTYQPRKCTRGYRVIALRKNISRASGENVLIEQIRYFFYITTLATQTADQIVDLANERCDQENVIEQLKNGVNALRVPLYDLVSNWAYMVIAALAWNIKSWFALMMHRKSDRHAYIRMEFRRFLNTIILIPAMIIRRARSITIRLIGYTPAIDRLLTVWNTTERTRFG